MKTNCKQCGHVMDSEALTCPNCHAPNKSSVNMKLCVKCGAEIEARKKKCTTCGELQTSNNTSTMNKNNQNNSTNSGLKAFIALIVGAVIMYFAYPLVNEINSNATPLATVEVNEAKVIDVGGIYIFIKSQPKAKKSVLGTITQDKVIEILDKLNNITKDDSKDILSRASDFFNTVRENVNLQERIEKYVKAAKEQYPEVQGLVFSRSDLKEAEVIKFN